MPENNEFFRPPIISLLDVEKIELGTLANLSHFDNQGVLDKDIKESLEVENFARVPNRTYSTIWKKIRPVKVNSFFSGPYYYFN